MLYHHIQELIGETPLLEIPKSVHGFDKVNIYAKLEYYNPFGSVKDRTAYALLKDHIDEVRDNRRIILDCSSGNTGKALSTFASMYNTTFKTISGSIKVSNQYDMIKLLGGEIQEIPGKSECPDPNDPDNILKIIEKELSEHPDTYCYTDQFNNPKGIIYHYETTGQEIWRDLSGKVDYFCAGLGTSASSRGPASYIREHNPDLKVIGVVSDTRDFIPGIRNSGEMLEVGLFERSYYESCEEINSMRAIECMKTLISKVGVYSGPTGGASYAGLLQYIEQNYDKIPERSNCVFIVCDRVEPYLTYIQQRKPEYFGGITKDLCIYHITPEQEKQAQTLSVSGLQSFSESVMIIDTRSNVSFKNMHIPHSINLSYEQLIEMIDDDKMPFSHQQNVVLVCPTGTLTKRLSAYLNFK